MSAVPRETPGDLFAAPALLRFTQADRWHLLSDCSRYAVSKALVNGVPRYDAWRRGADGSKIPTNLGCFDSAGDAEDRCQAHLEGRYVVPKGEVWKP
jgi:hypothetical protein